MSVIIIIIIILIKTKTKERACSHGSPGHDTRHAVSRMWSAPTCSHDWSDIGLKIPCRIGQPGTRQKKSGTSSAHHFRFRSQNDVTQYALAGSICIRCVLFLCVWKRRQAKPESEKMTENFQRQFLKKCVLRSIYGTPFGGQFSPINK